MLGINALLYLLAISQSVQAAVATDVAAITLAFGPTARRNCVLTIESFLANAGPDIRFYVVTDNEAQLRRLISFTMPPDDLITIVEYQPPTGAAIATMRIKALKTFLFDIVPVECEALMYFDADVTIGLPLRFCFNTLDRLYSNTSSASIALFAETYGAKGETHHTGVMFMRRRQVASLLGVWRSEILNSGAVRDQTALARVVQRNNLTIQTLPFKKGHTILDFVGGPLVTALNMCCFVHYTHHRMVNNKEFGFTHDQARFYYETVLRVRYPSDVPKEAPRAPKPLSTATA